MLSVEETQNHAAFGRFMHNECRKLNITLIELRAGCNMKQNTVSEIKKGSI